MPDRTHFFKMHPAQRPTIGVLTPIVDPYQPFWLGVLDAAYAHDVNLVCFMGGTLESKGQPQVDYSFPYHFPAAFFYDLADPERLDGLVTWGGSGVGLGINCDENDMMQFMARYSALPVVNYEGVIQGIPSVVTDTYQGMCELMTHLIEVHGYRRIALIRGPKGHMESEERHRAYLDTLTRYGLSVDPDLICPPTGWRVQSGARMTYMLLDERHLRPGHNLDAIVATEINYALGSLQVLQERGVSVPGQIAVAAFNDRPEAQFGTPSITVMRKPFYAAGFKTVQAVLDLIAGHPIPDQINIPARLIVRDSCGCTGEQIERPKLSRKTWQIVDPASSLAEPDRWPDLVDRSRNLLSMSQEMLHASTVPQLMDVLFHRLPELDIRGAYVALYQEPQAYDHPISVPEQARLVLAFYEGRRIALDSQGLLFHARELVPDDILPQENACVFVATPLYFGLRQFGFALFQTGSRDGPIYGFLAQEIGSALQSILLAQEYQQTERALLENKASLRTLIEHIPVEFWAKGPDGRFFMQNSKIRELLGGREGSTLQDMDIDPDLRAEWAAQDVRAFSGETLRSEHTISTNGQDRIFTQIVAPVQVEGEVVAILGLMFDVTEQQQMEASLRQAKEAAERALAQIKTLSGLLPICANCKKVRDDHGYWQEVDQYMHEHTDVDISHGICPDCFRKLYPEYVDVLDKLQEGHT